MSTAAATPLSPRTADLGRDHRPSLVQLTQVELRKMVDTRAGFWLLASVVGLVLLVVVLTAALGDDVDRTFVTLLQNAVQPLNILLPVVGILLVTSEWSQRTALITFTLVPHRGRVLVAKILASLALTLVGFAICMMLAAIATALSGSGVDGAWSISATAIVQLLVYTTTATLIGFGFGAALLSSAPAIVLSFVVPLAVSAATGLINALDDVGRWVDQGRTLTPLSEHLLSGTEWARVVTTLLLWLGVPLAIGAYRFLRGEIR
jgi:ABC-2 type transport system permease protein